MKNQKINFGIAVAVAQACHDVGVKVVMHHKTNRHHDTVSHRIVPFTICCVNMNQSQPNLLSVSLSLCDSYSY